MSQASFILPARLQEIVNDFAESEGREKIELLLDYSARMPALPDWLQADHDQMAQVHECMTPVFIKAEVERGGMHFYFDVPPESPTVRGFAAILAAGLDGVQPEEVLSVPADFHTQMGLNQVLSSQRIHGITAILAYMKRLALAAQQQAGDAPNP